ncbi:MAG TPA: cupin domain-containing protein [Thermodesulfobacteriota bacterium]|nr:cupin domain-containing protein [Thermodesulfobacteriota bacterium]
MRKTLLVIGCIALGFLVGQVFAAPTAKYLIDSTPGEDVLINLDEWFPAHPVKDGESRSDMIFQSARTTVFIGSNKDPKGIGRHLHVTVDEIVYIYKGEGEMFINGKWVPVKAGDLHVCPRGVAHATRALPGKELLSFNMFAPPQPKNIHDRVMMDE